MLTTPDVLRPNHESQKYARPRLQIQDLHCGSECHINQVGGLAQWLLSCNKLTLTYLLSQLLTQKAT